MMKNSTDKPGAEHDQASIMNSLKQAVDKSSVRTSILKKEQTAADNNLTGSNLEFEQKQAANKEAENVQMQNIALETIAEEESMEDELEELQAETLVAESAQTPPENEVADEDDDFSEEREAQLEVDIKSGEFVLENDDSDKHFSYFSEPDEGQTPAVPSPEDEQQSPQNEDTDQSNSNSSSPFPTRPTPFK
jgi:hypothetical protein